MGLWKRWSDRRRIRQLARSWQQFRHVLEGRFRAPGQVSSGRERRFLRVQARVAQRLPMLGQVYGRRSLEQDAQAAMRDMTELMNRMSSLGQAGELTPEEKGTLLTEWHVLYLFLRKLEGTLTGSTADGVVLADSKLREAEPIYAGSRGMQPSRRSGMLGFVAPAAVIVAILWAAVTYFDIDRADLVSWIDNARSRITDTAEIAVTENAEGHGAAVAQAPTGETEVPAPAAPKLSQTFRMPRLVQPVVRRYGTTGALVLGGALLTGTLFLFGLRSR